MITNDIYTRCALITLPSWSIVPGAALAHPDDHGVRHPLLPGRGDVVGAEQVLVLDVAEGLVRVLLTLVAVIRVPPALLLPVLVILLYRQRSCLQFLTIGLGFKVDIYVLSTPKPWSAPLHGYGHRRGGGRGSGRPGAPIPPAGVS